MKKPTKTVILTPQLREHFYRRVSVEKTGCWHWTGGKRSRDNYGAMHVGGNNQMLAHRVSWLIYNGHIPDGLHVCHTCDNPICVNPNHLFLGDDAVNMGDCRAKGRTATGDSNGMRKHPESTPKGSRNGSSRLNELQVLEMIQLFKQGMPTPELGHRFGVAQATAQDIISGRGWKHITKGVNLYQDVFGSNPFASPTVLSQAGSGSGKGK